MTLWRISNHRTLTGEGGLRASGRWHTRGRRVVYCASHPAAALLEILVHLEVGLSDLPTKYCLMQLEAPEDLAMETVAGDDLPGDWIGREAVTRAMGDSWLAAGRSPLLVVPSTLVPETSNVLLNPAHADAGRITIVRTSDHLIDPRLMA